MPYTASLTESTSKNFATTVKLVSITFVVGVVVLTLVWIHAENLWWILGTALFFVGAISAIFGWVFYQHEKERRIYAESRAAHLEELIIKLRLSQPAAAPFHTPEPIASKREVPFEIKNEATVRDRELTDDEFKRLEEYHRIWEEEQNAKTKKKQPQVGYKQANTAAETRPDWAQGWYVDGVTGQYRKRT